MIVQSSKDLQNVLSRIKKLKERIIENRERRRKNERDANDDDRCFDSNDLVVVVVVDDDDDDDDSSDIDVRVFDLVRNSVQKLYECEQRVLGARKKKEDDARSHVKTMAMMMTMDVDDDNEETHATPIKGDSRRKVIPEIDDRLEFPSLTASSPVMSTPIATQIGDLNLNAMSVSPSPRRVTPSPVSAGCAVVERASSSQQQQHLPKSTSSMGGNVGAPRRIQPTLTVATSSTLNNNNNNIARISATTTTTTANPPTLNNTVEKSVQQQQQRQLQRINPKLNDVNANIINEASVETPEYIENLAIVYALFLERFHDGNIEKSIVDLLKMLSISPDAFPCSVVGEKESNEHSGDDDAIFSSGVLARKFAALVFANSGTLPFSLGPIALEALSESEAIKLHAPKLAQECVNFFALLAASATTVSKIYDDATPSTASRKQIDEKSNDNSRGGAVGTRADAASVQNANKFGLVSRANTHAREKWRDQLVALLSPDAKFSASSFIPSSSSSSSAASDTNSSGNVSKYYLQNASNAFARKCREVFDAAKSKEDARWLADVFVRKMLKSAGEGETEEDIGATVSAAKLSALRERLMGGNATTTSSIAVQVNSAQQQHQNRQQQNQQQNHNKHQNGRGGTNTGGGGRGLAGRGRGGGRGGRGNHHIVPTQLTAHQPQQHQQQNTDTAALKTLPQQQDSSFAALFQPAFRPYVSVLEVADSARFSAAVSRSLADALKALDENYTFSLQNLRGGGNQNEGRSEDDILRLYGVNPKDFTARALAARCCGQFLGLLRFCLDGYSSVAFDGLPTVELCVDCLKIAASHNELLLTLPWVSEYVKFAPWENIEDVSMLFSSKGFVDLVLWLRSAEKSEKLRIVGKITSSSISSSSIRSTTTNETSTQASSLAAMSVRVIRHVVRETLRFKAPTTSAKSLEYARLASASQSHPAGPVPKAIVASVIDEVEKQTTLLEVKEDALADWGTNPSAGSDFMPNLFDDTLLQKMIGIDVERSIAAFRNDTRSHRWSDEEIKSISVNGGVEQQQRKQAAAPVLSSSPSKGPMMKKPNIEKHVVVPVRKIAPVSAVSPTKITATSLDANSLLVKTTSSASTTTLNASRSLQRAFLAANPRHKNIVDFTVDAAVLASVDRAIELEIPNALKCVSQTLYNACKLAVSASVAEQKRLFAMSSIAMEQEKKIVVKPSLEDTWSSAFETAIERATMLALREVGGVIAKRAADDAAMRAGAAAAALLREPIDNEDGKKKASLSPEASAAAAVARDAARQSATERSKLSAPFELRKAIVDEASRKLRVALRNYTLETSVDEKEDIDDEEDEEEEKENGQKTTFDGDDREVNDSNLVADVQAAALSAIARALSEAQGWAPGSLLAVSRELSNSRNPRDQVGAKELARLCENCSNAIKNVLALDESWRDALFTAQQQQQQQQNSSSSSSSVPPLDAALGANAISTAAALLAKPSDAPGKMFKKHAEAGRPRDALAKALCSLSRASIALFFAPPQPALIKPDRHGGISLSSALVSASRDNSDSNCYSNNNNTNTDGTKQNVGWGVSRDGVCEAVEAALRNAFVLATPILETLDAFAPPDATNVWSEISGELLFAKNWIPVLRIFPHSPFAQLRLETVVRDVFAEVADGKALTMRLKKFLETQFNASLSSSSTQTNTNVINAMGTSLLLRFLIKLLDKRIEKYKQKLSSSASASFEERLSSSGLEKEDGGDDEKAFARGFIRANIIDELKSWELVQPVFDSIAIFGRSPQTVDKFRRRLFEFRALSSA